MKETATHGKTTEERPLVLIADDQHQILEALRMLLHSEGFRVRVASSPSEVLSEIASEAFDAALIDANYTRDTTSGAEGLALIEQMQGADPELPIILMTAWGNVELAVQAMRHGARDFVQKPWENARLLAVVRTQVELRVALRRARMLEAENALLRAERRPPFIATSSAMQPLLELITRIGPSHANVLITGEHGTGKEIVAHTLHALSARSNRSIVAVNTGALPDGTFESELFGHVKGAFTDARTDRIGRFELADGGTLFLDEIANVPIRQQAKLLRVLETGELERVGSSRSQHIDVRVLSATNADLRKDVAEGKFREDLLFRLNTIELRIPPLRERKGDIAPLAAHFLQHHNDRYRRQVKGIAPDAMQQLLAHAWPGNVRELDHTVERAVLLARESLLRAQDLGLGATQASANAVQFEELSLDAVEALLVRKALRRVNGNISQAAELLGLSRGALYRRMEKHGIPNAP